MSSLQESPAWSWSNDQVFITMISESELKNRPTRCRVMIPIYRSLLLLEPFCEGFVKKLLEKFEDIPQSFFIGRDCDMVQNLSTMLRQSILQQEQPRQRVDHFVVFVLASKNSCFGDEQFPSSEFVRSLACESGVFSLPAGARAIEKLKVQDEQKDENCAICLLEFFLDSEVAKLPCSHLYHYTCVLKWFVQNSTCPLCRFSCNDA